ncbi:DoxX family protein [Taibaiella sp. KBW10]|uniref:DoxX family protein n=1 Tax=Taibaiella sp. KBW10 TaxID=2153357 RepID=UPI000F5AB998|nr:DoxX family protein [Taibaiella sp. KBW10]RQO29652.1 DoxX family protein [Taibaiella sp. KBW10]
MKIVKLVIYILFALMFINSGLNKFFHYMPMPEPTEAQKSLFAALMQLTWLIPLVAVAEIIGGVLVLSNKYRALGAIILFPVMVGILLHHLVLDRSGMAIAAILMVINLWIIFDNRKKYKPMVK